MVRDGAQKRARQRIERRIDSLGKLVEGQGPRGMRPTNRPALASDRRALVVVERVTKADTRRRHEAGGASIPIQAEVEVELQTTSSRPRRHATQSRAPMSSATMGLVRLANSMSRVRRPKSS